MNLNQLQVAEALFEFSFREVSTNKTRAAQLVALCFSLKIEVKNPKCERCLKEAWDKVKKLHKRTKLVNSRNK